MKYLLAYIRWGDQITNSDVDFIHELTLFEVFKSSYLLPKTSRLRTTRTILRR